jgi:hypothetical protein
MPNPAKPFDRLARVSKSIYRTTKRSNATYGQKNNNRVGHVLEMCKHLTDMNNVLNDLDKVLNMYHYGIFTGFYDQKTVDGLTRKNQARLARATGTYLNKRSRGMLKTRLMCSKKNVAGNTRSCDRH